MADTGQMIEVGDSGLRASISAQGAELHRLQDAKGRDFLWNADPAFWAWHAPLLFPIIGRVKGDRIHVDGCDYPIKQHGFARLSRFDVVAAQPTTAHFRLTSSDETRRQYPYDFVLDVTYRVAGAALEIAAIVHNTGTGPLPASFGFHPAFRWPLPGSATKAGHEIVFEADELEPIRRLQDGLIVAVTQPSPVDGRHLVLDETLFAQDALIFDKPRSRRLTYRTAGSSVTVAFPDMPQLGLWSKPGAGFVCLEPWHGLASPADFDGAFPDKPGLAIIPRGGEQRFAMTITLGA